jgi:transcriptional regulator with XRE-family HTH domain
MKVRILRSSLGRYIRSRRKAERWTLRDLSRRTAIPMTTLHNYEAGVSEPKISDLAAIATVCGDELWRFVRDFERHMCKDERAMLVLRSRAPAGKEETAGNSGT